MTLPKSHETPQRVRHLEFCPMREKHIRSMMTWRYDTPYDAYNLTAEGTAADNIVQAYLLPENAYFAIYRRQTETVSVRELIGYCCFGPDARVPGGSYLNDALDVGLGLRPDLTGQGYGNRFVWAILDFGRKHYTPSAFRMTVAAFNTRAIRAYARQGFRRILEFQRTSDGSPFVLMTRQETTEEC